MAAPPFSIRPGRADDYAVYTELVAQLIPGDPIPPRSKFEQELPGTFFAEDRDGDVLGYVLVQHLGGITYVRHLSVYAHARRMGVGRALLLEAREEARAAGSPEWVLNVLPDNAPAIALYRSEGFRERFRSQAVRAPWTVYEACFAEAPRDVHVRSIAPEDDRRVERATGLFDGQIAPLRAQRNVLLAAEDASGDVVGAACFAPWFPGSHPFRARTSGSAFALLAALRPHAVTDGVPHETMNLVVEDHPALADALVAAGATVRMETVRMEGRV